jgi:hypothetical protein
VGLRGGTGAVVSFVRKGAVGAVGRDDMFPLLPRAPEAIWQWSGCSNCDEREREREGEGEGGGGEKIA